MISPLDTRIAFFGGAAQPAVVEAIVKLKTAGFDVVVASHDPREAPALRDAGVTFIDDRMEALLGSQVVITSLHTSADVENLYLGDEGLLELMDPGTFCIDLSVSSPRLAREIQAVAAVSDIEVLDRRIDKTKKMIKADKKYQSELEFFERVHEALDAGKPARSVACDEEEAELLASVNLLTNKPIIFAANMSESDFANGIENNPGYLAVKKIADEQHAAVLPICAEIEAEISGMDPEEKELFLADMGLTESGLDRLINACYSLLGLISYLTAGKPEVRAWTIKKGTKAPQAAGKIHSDFERGFIRAEVIAFDDLMACGTMAAAKEKGLVRSEGKEYVMQDGDIVLFRFNV